MAAARAEADARLSALREESAKQEAEAAAERAQVRCAAGEPTSTSGGKPSVLQTRSRTFLMPAVLLQWRRTCSSNHDLSSCEPMALQRIAQCERDIMLPRHIMTDSSRLITQSSWCAVRGEADAAGPPGCGGQANGGVQRAHGHRDRRHAPVTTCTLTTLALTACARSHASLVRCTYQACAAQSSVQAQGPLL